jgi:hypothetical protein
LEEGVADFKLPNADLKDLRLDQNRQSAIGNWQ